MGFENIKKKGEAMGKKPMAQILKVNKFEDPQMALNLIAHICTASEKVDPSSYFKNYQNLIKTIDKNIDDSKLLQDDFILKCRCVKWDLEDEIANNLFPSLKIAVAGGFSAGKSSLLNSLTKIGNLLPTGVEPVSVVNTFLNCQKETSKLNVKGINLKKELVLLNDEVLACIQHSSKSKTYVASVLDKILIDVPSEAYLDKITFVDTPGYNNSTNTDDADKDTAEKALKECDAIFWCIDIESGTITKKDLDMLKPYKEKPIVIFYTKMDKKSDNDVKKIVESTEKTCLKEFGREYMPVTVMAISCVNKKKYSTSHMTLQQVIEAIKHKCGGTADLLKRYQQQISNIFDEEIEASNEAIANYEEQRKESIKNKDKCYENYRNNKDYATDMKEMLKDVMLDSYDDIMEVADKRNEFLSEAIDGWCEALNREIDWEDKVGFFNDASALSKQHSMAVDKYKRLCNKDASYTYWKREDRESWYNKVCQRYDDLIKENKQHINDSETEYQQIVENKKTEEQLKKLLIQYKPQVLHALEDAYNKCIKQIQMLQNHLQTLEKTEKSDVFSAISGDNYERFLSCFSNGVDLSVCNQEGYSPVTWAVRSGNNEMVKFFINHDADLSMKDKRGYNALETAAMCHYQDMCELLMEADHSLINESQSLAKLAAMNNFTNWVSKFK